MPRRRRAQASKAPTGQPTCAPRRPALVPRRTRSVQSIGGEPRSPASRSVARSPAATRVIEQRIGLVAPVHDQAVRVRALADAREPRSPPSRAPGPARPSARKGMLAGPSHARASRFADQACCVIEPVQSALVKGPGRRSAKLSPSVPVAQLDRVLPSEGRGRTFEPCRAHQIRSPASRRFAGLFRFDPPRGLMRHARRIRARRHPVRPAIRLLLVDDHPLVRDGLRARLEVVPGFEVVGEAGNADEAQAQLGRCSPTLVLMDVGMKGVNGIDLTAALLEREPALLVLMLSMYDNPEYVQRAMQAGARGYVLKDAPASEIIAAIEAVAGGGTFLSPAVSRAPVPQPGAAAAAVVARERDPVGPGARPVEQADRARDGRQRAHRRGAPPEHQAQAVAGRPGGADQVRRRARGQARLSVGLSSTCCRVPGPAA